MIKYKIDVMSELKKTGWDYKRIKDKKALSQSTITRIKRGDNITTDALNKICLILRMQLSDVIEIVATDAEKLEYF